MKSALSYSRMPDRVGDPSAASAEEGGVGHYAPGSFASFVDVLPGKPSIGAFNYFTYYNGSASANRQFPIAGQIALNVDATSYADSPRRILGHATQDLWRILCPGRRVAVRVDGRQGAGDATRRPHGESERFGQRPRRHRVLAGGAQLDALSTNLHVDFFGGIYAPSGEFQENRLANQGLGYWTFEPGVLVSYLGQKNGFEVTTYIGYDINTENTDNGLPKRTTVPH